MEIRLKLTGMGQFERNMKELAEHTGHFMENHLFEVEEEVNCEYCGESQAVLIPVWISRVEEGWAYGPGGSTMAECIACGRTFELTWDDLSVELPDVESC